ncbi:MAG: C40 family peptidase [Bacteroidia bacterium]|nr:C40 family peptidase [Bacteroidia bacterium]
MKRLGIILLFCCVYMVCNGQGYDTAYYTQAFGYRVTSVSQPRLFDCVDLWLGTKYRLAGSNEDGIDCSRFAITIYNYAFGQNIDGTADELYRSCTITKMFTAAQGDLIFFKLGRKRVSHVGIYLGDNKFAHASSSKGIIISDVNEPYWKNRFAGFGVIK